MKYFKIYSVIFFITLFLFILINIFISFSWKFYDDNIAFKKDKFSLIEQQLFEINKYDSKILFRDTHIINYDFIPFVGPYPQNFKSKFINIDNNGRKTLNPPTCKKKLFLFGGSTTFGWLSTDNKTIASFLSNLINEKSSNICVYNYGAPAFYSKQENNFLINLIEKEKKPDYAIFLDGINEKCGGYNSDYEIYSQFKEINQDHRVDIFNAKISTLIKSMPAAQLVDKIFKKNTIIDQNKICSDTEYKTRFENRLKLRSDICKIYQIKCKSFLQPFSGIHGNFNGFLKESIKNSHTRKYNLFKDIDSNLINNISKSLDDSKFLHSYIDSMHYSHDSNRLIAVEIAKNIKDLLIE